MSLLLDALKKAADDKQKAEKNNRNEDAVRSATAEQSKNNTDSKISAENDISTEEALAHGLDEIEVIADEVEVEEKAVDERIAVTSDAVADDSYVVSDEALAMLINKTNREVKLGRRLAVLSALLVTFVIILAGGGYYYTVTLDEIAVLERKHRISMQAMKTKTRGEKDPDNVEIIRNLVSDANLEEKVEFAKKHIADKSESNESEVKALLKNNISMPKEKKAKVVLSIQKTNKTDPVEEKLNTAWSAYDVGDYHDARQNYEAVLAMEINNRDALLGLGAIAIIEKNNMKASRYYLALLQQDPRDPIATAALSGLRYDDTSLELHEKHLITMLEKTPDAAPLNFALGNVYAQQERWKAAQQAYFNAWQHDAGNADYLFNLAVSMDQLGKHEQAIDFYQRCLQNAMNKQVSFSQETVKQRIDALSGL